MGQKKVLRTGGIEFQNSRREDLGAVLILPAGGKNQRQAPTDVAKKERVAGMAIENLWACLLKKRRGEFRRKSRAKNLWRSGKTPSQKGKAIEEEQ